MEQKSISDKLRQAKMEVGKAIKEGILHIINENEKEKFPIGEVNDYLISNGIINERMDFGEIFSIAEPILRELGLEWYGVYGPEGIIVCKLKRVEEKKEERKAKTAKDVVEELEKRISKDGMAYIPENVYESINYCLTHLFGISLDDVVGRWYEQYVDDRFNRLRGVFCRGREWNGSGSIREDKEISAPSTNYQSAIFCNSSFELIPNETIIPTK